MAIALYRKYRSKSLDDIVGQSHVTDVLRRALDSDKIAHAYLLTGPRGVGKTSIARILAHEINGLEYTDESEHLDIIEIDAASNNGVDDVRELREKAMIAPAQAKRKVYIIDEVHMLSKPAFNALLKTLEEPPEHIVFILATTDFDKLPDTIVSRTQRYHFHAITNADIVSRLKYIAEQEKIAIDDEALEVIAERGGGSLRDSVSLLDQVQHTTTDGSAVSRDHVESILGLATKSEINNLIQAVTQSNFTEVIAHIQTIMQRGVTPATLALQLAAMITSNLAQTPGLVHLLEGLMEVPKSSHPETKLLVTLLSQIVEKPKNVAHQATVPIAPSITRAVKPPTKPATVPSVNLPQQSAPMTELQPESSLPIETTVVVSGDADLSQFNWQAVLEYAKANYTAVYAILSKCSTDVQGDKIVLYAGRKFNKTKLDSAKYRPILGDILAATGVGAGAHIEILDTTAPPKDSQAAKIAAMMGGGEEVDVS